MATKGAVSSNTPSDSADVNDSDSQAEDQNENASMSADKPGDGDMSNEMCVPLEALAMPGEDEHMVNPEVGDPVSYQVEGKVTRIEDGNAYVKPQTVNGKPLNDEAAKVVDDPESQEKQQLYDMARGMDQGPSAQAQAPAAGGMMQ